MSKPFLESYGRQTIQQLVSMKDSHRVDSLVLAVAEALGSKPETELSEAERVVLAVEALEQEVNSGGYEEFFASPTCEYTTFIVRSLELIGWPKVAAITSDAITALGLPERYDADTIWRITSELSEVVRDKLGECDSRFYEYDEDIEQRLFAYIEAHQHEIRIPHTGR